MLVLHGPNLNLLGSREPAVYGSRTLALIDRELIDLGARLGLEVTTAQANSEGALIDHVHALGAARANGASGAIGRTHAEHTSSTSVDSPKDGRGRGLVFNPGGYTHTSVALRDAIAAVGVPTIEVHLSNLYGRESFRHTSVTGGACRGVIMGLGSESYSLALHALASILLSRAQPA